MVADKVNFLSDVYSFHSVVSQRVRGRGANLPINIYSRTELENSARQLRHQDHSYPHFHTYDMPSNLHYLTVNDNKQRVREKLGLRGEEKDGVWRAFEVRDCIAFD